ncbi:MAG: hypothetical protein ACU837_04000 [Gammaproteobacteria bacterium]
MTTEHHSLSKYGLISALLAASLPAGAIEKPKTMEDMWKIIEAQQQQIDMMKAKLEKTEKAESSKTAAADVKGLERKTNVLSEEVEKLRTQLVIPEEKEYKSMYGFGPAASKVYEVGKGLSLGGYGEANYQAFVDNQGSAKDNADFERLVIYAGYKFTDNILFNSEIEFEHASTGEGAEEKGEVSVEFASLDFFFDPKVNARAGMLLLPMGFINLIHEPPFYFGNNRPEVERRIIPTTWHENGAGLFGELLPGLTYTAYAINGLDAEGFSSNGIRGGRQGGSKALAEDLAFVGRMEYAPVSVPGLSFGASTYLGNSGQNLIYDGQKPGVFTQLYEGHLQWKYRGLEFRALGAWGHIGDAAILSAAKGETIGEQNFGWYTEVGYDILPLFLPKTTQYLAPFFRYEMYDTIAKAPRGFSDDPSKSQQIYQIGLQYKPIPNIVIKADYRNFEADAGYVPDDFNLGLGFIF